MSSRVWAACLGSAMGGVTLALLLARGYPSAKLKTGFCSWEYPFMIQLTDVAIEKVKTIIDTQEPKPAGLRISVVGGGCSGFSYSMAFENKQGMLDNGPQTPGAGFARQRFFGDCVQRGRAHLQFRAFHFEQFGVLLDQRILGFEQNLYQRLLRQFR